jgi:glycosyltransferase involved in cell wall biosynthesis
VAQRIADALYERGHEVFVLTTQPYEGVRSLFPRIRERTLEAVYRFYPCNFYYLRHDRSIPFLIRILWHLVDLVGFCSRRAMAQVIQDEDPDVIITHNLKGIGVSIGSEIQRQGIPHIHTLHDVQLSVPSGLLIVGQEQSWLNRSFLRRWYEVGVRREIGTPDLVLSPSKFLADFYQARGLFTDTRMAVRTQFLYVGQLETHKGIMELFDALNQVGEEIELHIAGEGSLSEMVVQRAERDARIYFHGFVSLKHLIRLLQTADAVVIPSICYENSPTVIYESFLVGVPVIASHVGGIPELIEEGVTGLLVKPGDVSELAQAMKTIHQQRDQWWEKSQLIRDRAQPYSIKAYVDRLESLIKEIV